MEYNPAEEGIQAGKTEARGVLSASWIDEDHVAVWLTGPGRLHIANVNRTALGWRTFYLGTGRKNGRKHYDYPADAIKAYFGKRIQIEG